MEPYLKLVYTIIDAGLCGFGWTWIFWFIAMRGKSYRPLGLRLAGWTLILIVYLASKTWFVTFNQYSMTKAIFFVLGGHNL
jgi:hypothetical protein